MSTVSFAAKTGASPSPATPAAEPAAPDQTLTVLPPPADGTVGHRMPEVDDMAGAWDERTDVKLPRVNLIHKTSKTLLITEFGIGSFVLNQEVKLSNGEIPFAITPLFSKKDFIQKLPFGSSETPVVFKTPEEVRANGGTLNWSRAAVAEKIFFDNRAHVEIIFAAPESFDASTDESGIFPYEFEGAAYARAILTVAATAYTSVGKDLATLRTQNKVMRQGLRYGKLDLTSREVPHPKNPWLIPVIKFTGENSPDFVKFVETFR